MLIDNRFEFIDAIKVIRERSTKNWYDTPEGAVGKQLRKLYNEHRINNQDDFEEALTNELYGRQGF